MRKRVWMTLGYWALMGLVAGWAQESHKTGLWLVTTTTRIQGQGEAPGNFAAGAGATATEGVVPECLTRDILDNYGVILPPSLKSCELQNVHQTADSFKADMTCKGSYNGIGSVESTWTDPDHVVGKVRFVSRGKGTNDTRALAWSEEAKAVFKSADCGNIKPRPLPSK